MLSILNDSIKLIKSYLKTKGRSDGYFVDQQASLMLSF